AASALQEDSPDVDAYQAALQQAADHMVAARVAGARASLDAWNVLTAQQQQEVTDAMSTMGAMYHGMMGGAGMGWGMMGGPGMRGGMTGGGMMHRMMHGGSGGGGATPGAGGRLY
ncbi:MAG TPA: hypothetical protein VE173_04540, partial [Longimicrobiales bacterium]|nr:hypothetical protein [Longimicrobiales bacterium]